MAVGAGIGSCGTGLGPINVPCEVPRELGFIERSIGAVTGQSLHAKLGQLRDKIEGSGLAGCTECAPTILGLADQFSESESVLRACHSLLDDISGKF